MTQELEIGFKEVKGNRHGAEVEEDVKEVFVFLRYEKCHSMVLVVRINKGRKEDEERRP